MKDQILISFCGPGCDRKAPSIHRPSIHREVPPTSSYPILYFQKAVNASQDEFDQVMKFIKQKIGVKSELPGTSVSDRAKG